jgi:dihydroflavonol-4-reductase
MTSTLTLVTGATGLVGNNVVRMLLERGQPARVLVRAGCDPRPLEGLPVEVVRGDVRDIESVRRACQGVGCVVHAAGHVRIGWTGLELHRAINVEGTRHVAAAANEAGARVVHVSSVDALGIRSLENPVDEETPPGGSLPIPYVVTKREAEQVVLDEVGRGLAAMIVNPGFMLGPWDWKPSSGQMLLAVGRRRFLLAPPGWFGACDVRDVAAAILTALQCGAPGRRYITTGPTIRYADAMRLFAEVTGARVPISPPGPVILAVVGRACDLWAKLTGHEPPVNSGALRMARLPKSYTSARAERELGYRARPLRETVQDAWDWFREHGYA